MSAPIIRTNDEVLRRALEGWWAEFAPLAPQSQLILTDLDDFPPLGEGEITFSRSKI